MSDLFDWADMPGAEIIAFPSWRHSRLKELAQRCVGYDENQAAIAVRKEAVKVVRQRLEMGVLEEGSSRGRWARLHSGRVG